jgi:lipoprotein-anchoring transpeptidase ErfK/SrfK
MQRASLSSLVCLLTVLASSTTFAGPLTPDPSAAERAQPSGIAVPAQTPAPVRRASTQGGLGGGFLDFLFGGEGRRYDSASAYRAYPGDLGAGVVESPTRAGQLVMDPRFVRQEVSYDGREPTGTIIISTNDRVLYLVQGQGRALRYGIGVGRPGFTWSGVHHISQKREWPDWTPPDEMLRRRPDLPRHMVGGPDNPLGARAMYLGSTLYRIHGSNEPWTIGTQVSSGCIRMRNEDVIDLYGRVKIGTKVVVI